MFETFEIIVEDKFERLKNLKNLFTERTKLNQRAEYMNEMLRGFKKICNKTTRSLFYSDYQNDSNLEYDNDLLDQYYLQIQNISDFKRFTGKNANIFYYKASVQYGTVLDNEFGMDSLGSGFVFSMALTKRIVYTSNENNFLKLILIILNTFSFWLSVSIISILDFIYFDRILLMFIKFHKKLIFLKFLFKNKLFSPLN